MERTEKNHKGAEGLVQAETKDSYARRLEE
jgi:hypothetical protein